MGVSSLRLEPRFGGVFSSCRGGWPARNRSAQRRFAPGNSAAARTGTAAHAGARTGAESGGSGHCRVAPAVTPARAAVGHRALMLERFGALPPPLRHPGPCRLARRVARELGHLGAICGVPQKFFRRIHGRIHRDVPPCSLGARAAGMPRTIAKSRNSSACADRRCQHRASLRHAPASVRIG